MRASQRASFTLSLRQPASKLRCARRKARSASGASTLETFGLCALYGYLLGLDLPDRARQHDLQDAVLKARLDGISINPLGNGHAATEGTVGQLVEVVAYALLGGGL